MYDSLPVGRVRFDAFVGGASYSHTKPATDIPDASFDSIDGLRRWLDSLSADRRAAVTYLRAYIPQPGEGRDFKRDIDYKQATIQTGGGWKIITVPDYETLLKLYSD